MTRSLIGQWSAKFHRRLGIAQSSSSAAACGSQMDDLSIDSLGSSGVFPDESMISSETPRHYFSRPNTFLYYQQQQQPQEVMNHTSFPQHAEMGTVNNPAQLSNHTPTSVNCLPRLAPKPCIKADDDFLSARNPLEGLKKKRRSIVSACEGCHAAKARCSVTRPCWRCQNFRKECRPHTRVGYSVSRKASVPGGGDTLTDERSALAPREKQRNGRSNGTAARFPHYRSQMTAAVPVAPLQQEERERIQKPLQHLRFHPELDYYYQSSSSDFLSSISPPSFYPPSDSSSPVHSR